nr:MAG TPA: 4Fe-4S binding domain protein [Caudoviricetes sp.]
MLRCVQCGISISDLELLSIGMVNDMFIELKNDDYDYPKIATQEDIDAL